MFTHPVITEALASQHRRDLIAQSDAYRLARTARTSTPSRPGLFRMGRRPASRAVTAAAALVAAAAVLMGAPAATRWAVPRASAAHFVTPQVSAKHIWTPQISSKHFV